MNNFIFKVNEIPPIEKIIELYTDSGLNRPIIDYNRIKKMYLNSNLIISVWDGDNLIAIARALTDFCYACYLADLAVKKRYQKKGIGRKLIKLILKEILKKLL